MTNEDVLREVLKQMHEIYYGDLDNFHYQQANHIRLVFECRVLYRNIKWGLGFELNTKRIKFYNIIFLNRYDYI